MQKVVFLDFDGVLNSHRWLERPRDEAEIAGLLSRFPPPPCMLPEWAEGLSVRIGDGTIEDRCEEWALGSIDPTAVAHLDRIVTEARAEVVVSSSWRHGYNLAALQWVLAARGFTGTLAGVTPTSSRHRTRGAEIAAYLAGRARPAFCILDDCDDMGELRPHLVEVDSRVGLTATDAEQALAILAARS